MMTVVNAAVGDGCREWARDESRLITYHIRNGVLEASTTCEEGFRLRLNSTGSVQDQHQLQQLPARCLGNVWDMKPPRCFGIIIVI